MLESLDRKKVYKDSSQTRTPEALLFPNPFRGPPSSGAITPLAPAFSAGFGPSPQQIAISLLMVGLVSAAIVYRPDLVGSAVYWLLWLAFMGNAVIRLAACFVAPARDTDAISKASNENLPTYSVIVALYKEVEIVPQLLAAMLRLDYPRDRLEIIFALEADDHDTIAAFRAQDLPSCVRIVEVPEGLPRTKPRALNHALALATGELCVIYDAEDQPDPDQLRAAALAFATGSVKLACVQAPLRPVGATTFIGRQFAAEYAVQFDVLLPALNRLGLPFPLGGTSNHFKVDVLKAIGAWDPWNVTEDADLGLRLAQYGYESGLITPPTHETPPAFSRVWIPQRTRWIKGYLQTCLVHTRLNTPFRPRVWTALLLGVGLSAGAAICYAPFCALVVISMLLGVLQSIANPAYPPASMVSRDLALFIIGGVSALMTLLMGARRAGLDLTWRDLLAAPSYWCLQSVAAGFALHQLVVRPFHWDKTEHAPVDHAAAEDARPTVDSDKALAAE